MARSNRIQPNGAALLALRVSLQPNADVDVDVTTVWFLGAVRHALPSSFSFANESKDRV